MKSRPRQIAKRKLPIKLADEEWDFTSCPEHEWSYCLEYELSRESQKVQDRVARYRSRDWKIECPDPTASSYYREKRFVSFYSNLPEFPATPWLKISVRNRKTSIKEASLFSGPFLHIAPERMRDEETDDFCTFPKDMGFGEFSSVHAIEIDWMASDEAIMQSFGRWLKHNRPSYAKPKEVRGRTNAMERLRFLGAYRLMSHYGNLDTVISIAKAGGHDAPKYDNESSWNRAYRQAKHLIQRGSLPSVGGKIVSLITESDLTKIGKAKAQAKLMTLTQLERRKLARHNAEEILNQLLTATRSDA